MDRHPHASALRARILALERTVADNTESYP